MKKLLTLGLTAAMLASLAAPAHAFGGRRKSCAPSCDTGCAPAVQVSYVDKTVTAYKPEWKEKEVSYTVNKMVTREVVEKQKYMVQVPEYKDEKRTVTTYTMKPTVVERDVTTCRYVPVCDDGCNTGCDTGCGKRGLFGRRGGRGCGTPCVAVMETKKVSCTVMQCVPETKEVTVKVCTYKTEERTQEVKRIVCEWKPETVKAKQRYCEMVPYQTTVKVAVCTPVAASCGTVSSCH